MLLLPLVMFAALVAPFLFAQSVWPIAVLPLCTLPISMVLLALTALTDPGIIPRRVRNGPVDVDEPGVVYYDHVDESSGLPFQSKHKYCETCHIYRPDRASHCRSCDNCGIYENILWVGKVDCFLISLWL